MQVLKQEIRNSIIQSATRQFLLHGFEQTTTRAIAAEVPISVSNLYKYFHDKESLFVEIVQEYHAEYLSRFKSFLAHPGPDLFDAEEEASLVQALFASIRTGHTPLVLIMDKSRGTRFSGFKEEVTGLLVEHIHQGIVIQNRERYLLEILARHFLEGVVDIARDYQGDDWALRNLELLVRYHRSGMASLHH